MKLYIGGFGQGKAAFVKRTENITELFEGGQDNIKLIKNYKAINKLNLLIKRLLKEKADVIGFVESLEAEVIICDEVGNGIVPIEKEEEEYREYVGRSCCILAEKSESVIRIFCGVGQVIK